MSNSMPQTPSNRNPQSDVPRTIGRYAIEHLTSVGKRVAVYRGYSHSDGTVAIKVLHKSLCRNQKEILRFYDDAKLSMQFEHPHILPVLEVNENSGQHFVVTPWATKGSLKDFISEQGPLWEDEAIAFVEKLQSGLEVIQDCLGYHGRLHPGNILMLDRHTPCIAGISRLPVNGQTRSPNSRVSAQVACAAPEVIKNQEELSESIDQYSMASILYFMITGRLPSGRASLNRMIKTRLRDNPRWEKWLPSKTSNEVVKALQLGMRKPVKSAMRKGQNVNPPQAHPKTIPLIEESQTPKTGNFERFSTHAKQFAASLMLLSSLR